MLSRAALFLCFSAMVMAGCRSDRAASQKPTGTTSDPVDVCERLADVCKLDGSRLGVCSVPASGKGLVCVSQH